MESIETFVTQQLAAWEVPGCAVAGVRDKRVELAAGWGQRDREAGLPVTEHTLFTIGSTTKAFAARLLSSSPSGACDSVSGTGLTSPPNSSWTKPAPSRAWSRSPSGSSAPGMRHDFRMRSTNGDIREIIRVLVASIAPLDELEAADQAGTLDWIRSGADLFRTVPPGTPPKHVISYFVPVDARNRCLLLGDHRKSGLWLPPGGHVDDGEDPRDTVSREAAEELRIDARLYQGPGVGQPFFLTVTPTVGITSHTDVSLWFVLDVSKTAELRPDPREYRGVRWFGFDEQEGWPGGVYDPQMHRFVRKLTAALGEQAP
jgi:8-oxo-dGTP diphosphatase